MQRIRFEFVVQNFDDDCRAAERTEQRKVESFKISAAETELEQRKKSDAEQNAENELSQSGHDHLPAGRNQLLRIHLQTDDEQQQNQPDLGDDFDILCIGDESESELRSDNGARDEIADDDRLLQFMRDKTDYRGGDNCDTNVV